LYIVKNIILGFILFLITNLKNNETMESFLKQLQLSDGAVNIYVHSLGQLPLTYFELNSLVPNLSREEFEGLLSELVNSGLLIQLEPSKPGILLHYLAVPPVAPIISYYENINTNLPLIAERVQEVLAQSLRDIFSDDKNKGDLGTIYTQFEDIKNDIDEDVLIQKQDLEDSIKEFDSILEIKGVIIQVQDILVDLHEKLKIITQTQFAGLIKILMTIKSDIVEGVQTLGLKKSEQPVIDIVESIFKEKLQAMVNDFTTTLHEAIEEEFKYVLGPLNEQIEAPVSKILESAINLRNEFKMLVINLLNNFEEKMNKIYQAIKGNQANASENVTGLENVIIESLNDIVNNSINQVSGLNKPIEGCMQNLLEIISNPMTMGVDDLWLIKSRTKINEEIMSQLSISKDQITLIIPKIENHLNIEAIQNIPASLNVRIASSDPHTNSLVKSFKAIKNVEFRQLQNDNIVAMKADNFVLISILKSDSNSPIDDVIGISSNFGSLINLFSPIVTTTWGAAQSDRGGPAKTPGLQSTPAPTPTPQPRQAVNLQPAPTPQPRQAINLQPAPTPTRSTPSATAQPTTTGDYSSSFQPKPGDQVGALINDAFNALLAQLNTFKGSEFSKALLSVTDLILESKGYSVTLHNIRKWINNYKTMNTLMSDDDKTQIAEAIENWKKRLIT